MYTYIHIYVYMYKYMYTNVYIYIYVYTFVHINYMYICQRYICVSFVNICGLALWVEPDMAYGIVQQTKCFNKLSPL